MGPHHTSSRLHLVRGGYRPCVAHSRIKERIRAPDDGNLEEVEGKGWLEVVADVE